MPVRRDTLVRQAYDAIRGAIVEGRFLPGTKLTVRPLTDELGLSPTPIKLALEALARDGIVSASPRRGHFVPTFDVKDIKEIFTLRTALDRLAAELAASRLDRQELVTELEENVRLQRRSVQDGDLARYADLNNEFHQAIWIGSENSRLIRVSDSIYGQVRLLVSTSAGRPGRPQQAVREHAQIVKAIRLGDAATVVNSVSVHTRHSEQALLEGLGLGKQS